MFCRPDAHKVQFVVAIQFLDACARLFDIPAANVMTCKHVQSSFGEPRAAPFWTKRHCRHGSAGGKGNSMGTGGVKSARTMRILIKPAMVSRHAEQLRCQGTPADQGCIMHCFALVQRRSDGDALTIHDHEAMHAGVRAQALLCLLNKCCISHVAKPSAGVPVNPGRGLGCCTAGVQVCCQSCSKTQCSKHPTAAQTFAQGRQALERRADSSRRVQRSLPNRNIGSHCRTPDVRQGANSKTVRRACKTTDAETPVNWVISRHIASPFKAMMS